MDRNITILIIIIIILVAALGVMSGFFLQGYLFKNNDTNSSNQTNVSVNNTTTNNTMESQSSDTSSDGISQSEAVDIAKKYIPEGYAIVDILAFNTPPPRYIIYYEDVNNPNGLRGSVAVDAKTGEILNLQKPHD